MSWILFASVNLEERLCHNQGLLTLHSMWALSMTVEHQQGNFWADRGNKQPLEKPPQAAAAHKSIDLNLMGAVVQLHQKPASDLFQEQYMIRPHAVWDLALLKNIWRCCSVIGLDLRKLAICKGPKDIGLSWKVSRMRSFLCGTLQKTCWETVRKDCL